ncbi:MAG: aminoacyl-tRNA hydrolase [Candidatus Hatepunaea meridiana]|nr:aminoacyl-tRNA hydrolase [Candidatus Hatepunaea meridiana]
MRLIVGLGNPGKRYQDTWHNLGAKAVILLAQRWGLKLSPGRGDYIFSEHIYNNRKVGLMIPTSFMNRSGLPVGSWINYYKVAPSDILIIYDDHDLSLGRIRIRKQGSSGGHRGMSDIIRMIGSEDIPRLKIGIRTDVERYNLADQVLSKIPKKYNQQVNDVLVTVEDAVIMALDVGITNSMNRFNRMEIE